MAVLSVSSGLGFSGELVATAAEFFAHFGHVEVAGDAELVGLLSVVDRAGRVIGRVRFLILRWIDGFHFFTPDWLIVL